MATPSCALRTLGISASREQAAQASMSDSIPCERRTRASAPADSAASGLSNPRAAASAISAVSLRGPGKALAIRPAAYTSSTAGTPSVPEQASWTIAPEE